MVVEPERHVDVASSVGVPALERSFVSKSTRVPSVETPAKVEIEVAVAAGGAGRDQRGGRTGAAADVESRVGVVRLERSYVSKSTRVPSVEAPPNLEWQVGVPPEVPVEIRVIVEPTRW